jgi:hypothetical protein
MAGAGIEPAFNSDATGSLPCGCVICQQCRDEQARHLCRTDWFETASYDADLQLVIAAWGDMPETIHWAMMALIGSQA